MTTTTVLERELAKRILVLDGAMGTMVQRLKLSEADFRGDRFREHAHDLKGDNDVLVLTQPEAIAGIHAEYLAAGADIIETNTFNATSVSQADYKLEAHVYEINLEAAKLARRVTDEWTARTPGPAEVRRRRAGTDDQDTVDLARRQQSRRAIDHV